MSIQRQTRHIDDTEVAIAATLQRPDGTAVDLTSLTTRFKMVDTQGTVKVAETSDNVTVTDATNGKCQYDPQAADVDTAGTFYGYFTTEDGSGNKDTFPANKGGLEIVIEANA